MNAPSLILFEVKIENIDKTIAENQITPLTQNGILKILPTNKPMRKTRSA